MTGRALLTVGSRAAVLLVLLATTPFVVDALGPSGYGIWVVVVAIAGLYGIVDAGFAPAVGRLVAHALARDDRRAAREVTSTALAGNLLTGLVLLVPAWLLAPQFVELLAPAPAGAELAVRLAFVTGVAVNAAGVLDGALIGLDRIALLAGVRVVYAVLLAAGIAFVLVDGGGIAELAAAQLAAWAVAIAVAAVAARHAFGEPLVSLRAIAAVRVRALLRFGLPPQASRVSLIGALQYERLMVAALVGAGAAAGYGIASLLVGGLRTLMGQAALPLLPALTATAARGDRAALDAQFAAAAGRLAVGFAAAFGLLAAAVPAILHAWIGPVFDDAARYTWILTAGFAASALATTAYALVQATGQPGIEARTAAVTTVLYLLVGAALLAVFGAAGAAVGTAVGLIAGSAYCFAAVVRLGLAPRGAVLAAWAPLATAAALALPFAMASARIVDGGVSRPAAAGVAVAVGTAYLAVLLAVLRLTGQLPAIPLAPIRRALAVPTRRIAVALACLALAAGAPLLVLAIAVWPTATMLAVATCTVAWLAWRLPPYAFATTLLLYGIEGSLKLRIAAEGVPLASPEAFAAALIDACLVIAAAGVLARDRLRTPRRIWSAAGRLERAGLGLLALWLALALPHLLLAPSLQGGLEGLRLTQLYVLALPVAAVVFCRPRGQVEGPLTAMLAAFGLVAGYAALRAAIGPTTEERLFALAQDSVTEVSTAFRAVGSFSGAVGMESYLVPVVGFCLVLGLLSRRRRPALAIALLGAAALVGSYGRAPLVAVAAVAVTATAMLVAGGRATGARRLAIASALVLGTLGLGAGAVVAGTANDKAAERARGLIDPLGDESMQLRLESWQRDLEDAVREPFGRGLGVVGDASGDSRADKRETDNAFLKVLVEQGILGALAFACGLLALGAGLARRLLREGASDSALGLAALLGFGGFLVLATTGEFFEQPGKVVAWSLLGIALGQALRPAGRKGAPHEA